MSETDIEVIQEEGTPRKKGRSAPPARVPAAPLPTTPPEMLARAIADKQWDAVERLMAFQERWEARNARKAYDAAIAAASADIEPIIKDRKVDYEAKQPGSKRTSYKHEDLAGIERAIKKPLAEHGLSYRFRTSSVPNEPITVTCIIAHRDGHSEENSLVGPRDETGGKNSIQAIGSTLTYLQRYTLKAALGLSAAEDDDGRGANGKISPEQYEELQRLIVQANQDIEKFCHLYGIDAVKDLPARAFEGACDAMKRKAKS